MAVNGTPWRRFSAQPSPACRAPWIRAVAATWRSVSPLHYVAFNSVCHIELTVPNMGTHDFATMDRPAIEPASPARAPRQRARLTNGRGLRPGINGRTVWARLYRDTEGALTAHLGGEDRTSETQRLLIRRCAALEVELLALEGRFTKTREAGEEPGAADLDLFARLANGQRRFLETLGLQAVPRDVTPALGDYLRKRST